MMGATASNRKNDKRGSVNNKNRLAAFSVGNSQVVGSCDWGSADPRWLAAVIVAAAKARMEVAFALSRDGGAYSLKLYDFESGERVQLWFNGDAVLDDELGKVFAKLDTENL